MSALELFLIFLDLIGRLGLSSLRSMMTTDDGLGVVVVVFTLIMGLLSAKVSMISSFGQKIGW